MTISFKKSNPLRVKYITTTVVYYCTFTFGAAFTFLSPTVRDFRDKFESDIATVSIVFTILTASYLFGALASGIVLRFIRREWVVLFLLGCMSAPLYILTHVPNLIWFFLFSFILGFGAGGYDTTQVVWIIDIWRQKSAPYILGQHFAYSVGTVVPPLLLAPFLKAEDDDKKTTTPISDTTEMFSTTEATPYDSDLFIPFIVAATLVLASMVLQLILIFKPPTLKEALDSKEGEAGATAETEEFPQNSKSRTILLVVLSCCVIASYQGLELTTMQFLPTFSAFSDLELSDAQGAEILFGCTLAFAIFRFVGIVLVLRVPPAILLVGNFILLAGGNFMLLLLARNSKTWLWIASCTLGAGMSTVYGGYYAFIQKHLHITNTIAAAVAVSGGLISSIYPIVVGSSVVDNVSILCYVNFLSIFVLIVSFAVTYWFTMIRGKENVKE